MEDENKVNGCNHSEAVCRQKVLDMEKTLKEYADGKSELATQLSKAHYGGLKESIVSGLAQIEKNSVAKANLFEKFEEFLSRDSIRSLITQLRVQNPVSETMRRYGIQILIVIIPLAIAYGTATGKIKRFETMELDLGFVKTQRVIDCLSFKDLLSSLCENNKGLRICTNPSPLFEKCIDKKTNKL